MKTGTYRCLQIMAATCCAASTWTYAEALPSSSMSAVLIGAGWGDWAATALVSLSFGMVSLLQRFRRSEAGSHYGIFIAAHMGGSLISGIVAYLLAQGTMDSPNRFYQALAIGVAGWGGSTLADMVAIRFNKSMVSKIPA